MFLHNLYYINLRVFLKALYGNVYLSIFMWHVALSTNSTFSWHVAPWNKPNILMYLTFNAINFIFICVSKNYSNLMCFYSWNTKCIIYLNYYFNWIFSFYTHIHTNLFISKLFLWLKFKVTKPNNTLHYI